MLILEPDVKSIAPNMALMKFARWCEYMGHEYQYVRGMVEPDIDPTIIVTSCIFSYNAERYTKLFNFYKKLFPSIKIWAGGGFPTVYPEWFIEQGVEPHIGMYSTIEDLIPKYNVEIKCDPKVKIYPRNKIILYSSKGCNNKCGYCIVPKLEGGMKSYTSIAEVLETAKTELPDATSLVLYDNNITEHACFDDIMDELKEFDLAIDVFGLHVDSFTKVHAKRFAELKWGAQGDAGTPYIRFSYDKMKYSVNIERALRLVIKYDIKVQFFAYMLYNFMDSPDDFWERLITAQQIRDRVERDTGVNKALYLFPQKYVPLRALTRNEHVATKYGWTEAKLHGLARLYTYIHGFLSVTKSQNLFNWIGHTKEEFFANIEYMHTHKSIEKKSGKLILEGEA